MNSIFTNVLIVFHVAVCLLLCLVVLMQRPKQEGLGAAFGGGMTDQAFGARTTDVLQKGTVYLGTLLFIITLTLAVLVGTKSKSGKLDMEVATNSEAQLADNAEELAAVLAAGAEENADAATTEEDAADEVTPAVEESSEEESAPEEETSTDAAGAEVGAALGGIIGHQSGKGLEGAELGAELGAAAGGNAGGEIPAEEPAAE